MSRSKKNIKTPVVDRDEPEVERIATKSLKRKAATEEDEEVAAEEQPKKSKKTPATKKIPTGKKNKKATAAEEEEDEEENEKDGEEYRPAKASVKKVKASVASSSSSSSKKGVDQFKPSELKPEIQELIGLVFDKVMFIEALANGRIDTSQISFGKLSQSQIKKGVDVLFDLEKAIKAGNSGLVNQLSRRFYGTIPHLFGFDDAIDTLKRLKVKQDLMNMLNEIEIVQTMLVDLKKKSTAMAEGEMIDVDSPPNPLDEKYQILNCDLDVLPKSSKEYKIIQQYYDATRSFWPPYVDAKIQEIFTIDRHGEAERFAELAKIKNRKLCWYGCNVASVAAILHSGLRIMPHSGGRGSVGRGIYFTSEASDSAQFARPYDRFPLAKTAIMFLSEVVTGAEYDLTEEKDENDGELAAPPNGFDSIVARGRQEPDPTKNTTIQLDGHEVVVPQSRPIEVPEYESSRFNHRHYVISKESQQRIRYAIQLAWPTISDVMSSNGIIS